MNELVSSVQGILPTIVSAYQKAPWAFWLLGILLIAMVVYFATLPRRRRSYLRRNFVFFTRTAEGSWVQAPFKGAVVYQFLRLKPNGFIYKGKMFEANYLETYRYGKEVDGWNYWHRDYADSFDVDVLAMKLQRPSRRLPRWPLAIVGVIILGLLVWFIGRPAIANWRDNHDQPTESIQTPVAPVQPAPLASKDDILPAPAASPTPQPDRIDPYSVVVDLDRPAGPGELEQMLLALADRLPPFPNIIPDWVSFGAAQHPTQINRIEGMDGFIIVFATDQGLELHRTSDELIRIGEPLYLSDYRATLLARGATKGIGYDVDSQQWLETIDYPRGRVRVLVTEHGNPALVVVSSGMAYNHRPWHIPAAAVAVILVIAFMVWLRGR